MKTILTIATAVILWIIFLNLLYKSDNHNIINNKECTFYTGIILAKRDYCYQDCKYTLIIDLNEETLTEVTVPKEKYQFLFIGQKIDILKCQ